MNADLPSKQYYINSCSVASLLFGQNENSYYAGIKVSILEKSASTMANSQNRLRNRIVAIHARNVNFLRPVANFWWWDLV
jgi:hypothetical protein